MYQRLPILVCGSGHFFRLILSDKVAAVIFSILAASDKLQWVSLLISLGMKIEEYGYIHLTGFLSISPSQIVSWLGHFNFHTFLNAGIVKISCQVELTFAPFQLKWFQLK